MPSSLENELLDITRWEFLSYYIHTPLQSHRTVSYLLLENARQAPASKPFHLLSSLPPSSIRLLVSHYLKIFTQMKPSQRVLPEPSYLKFHSPSSPLPLMHTSSPRSLLCSLLSIYILSPNITK